MVVWNMWYFFHILGIVIPTDELIFFRGLTPMEFLDSTRDPTPAGAILFLQELNQRKITGEPPKKVPC